jgi:hypothetical protein
MVAPRVFLLLRFGFDAGEPDGLDLAGGADTGDRIPVDQDEISTFARRDDAAVSEAEVGVQPR